MKAILAIFFFFGWAAAGAHQSYDQVQRKLSLFVENVEKQDLSVSEALLNIEESDMECLLKPSVREVDRSKIITEATVACSGAVQGVLCFDLPQLEALKEEGRPIIWVTEHIRNDDLCYLNDFAGIFALSEDPSSHAVIVARVHNIPCLTLPTDVTKTKDSLITPHGVFEAGEEVTLDGFNGLLLSGLSELYIPADEPLVRKVMEWAEEFAYLEVHGNADSAEEAKEALDFGARGVDPRTEHMFFHPTRLHLFRKMIFSDTADDRAIKELKAFQKDDFIALFQTMPSYPVKIRLLDPPLHEFISDEDQVLIPLAKDLNVPLDLLRHRVRRLKESNPMMGHRGVRLLLTHPQILKMQVEAIFEASLDPSLKDSGVIPHIVIPMIISPEEVIAVKSFIDEVYHSVSSAYKKDFLYRLGIMVETPRACLLADEIAPLVDFISFGTNDLTGQTLALSRGDVFDKFLHFYLDHKLLDSDPFSQIDPAVQELMRITVVKMRLSRPDVVIGICGEHASQKSGIFICHQLGFNTISCAAFRVPVAKLFAAQAAILYPRIENRI